MDSTALLELFRSDVRDTSEPYLWEDAEIFSYMDDAQKMFCRLQGGIADSSSALTLLNVSAGDKFAAYDPRILKLRSAYREDNGREIELLNYEDLQFRQAESDYGYRPGFRIDNSEGELRALILGMEANRVRLWRIPTEAQDIRLVVYRLPLETISAEGQELEIDEVHHRHLLHWMKHLAHQKQDAETYDRGRAEQFRTEFLAYCDQAKAEREKREHKYRTIAYGGY